MHFVQSMIGRGCVGLHGKCVERDILHTSTRISSPVPSPHRGDSGWDPLTVSPLGKTAIRLGSSQSITLILLFLLGSVYMSHIFQTLSQASTSLPSLPSFHLPTLAHHHPEAPLSGPRNNSPPFPTLSGGKRREVINLRRCTVEKN